MEPAPEEPRISFQCKTDSVKPITTLLACVANGKKDQFAFIAANETGLRLSIENQAKSLHAVVYLKAELFRTFEFVPLDGDAEVNLSVLLDCLQVYGGPTLGVTSLHMMYSPDSGSLRLLLEESGVLTECEISTVDAGDELDFPSLFRRYPTVNRAVIVSSHLREAFAELCELPGAANVGIHFGPTEPNLRFTAAGSGGSATVDFPQGSESFVSFMSSGPQDFRFHLSLLQLAVKALAYALESFVRLNDQGMLCINHKVVSDEGKESYVSFIVLPDIPEEEDMQVEEGRRRAGGTGTTGTGTRTRATTTEEEEEDSAG